MKKSNAFKSLELILVIFPLLIANCKINTLEINRTQDMKTISTLSLPQYTSTSSLKLRTASPVLTSTPTPLEDTRTPFPTVIPTFTPVPTLSSEGKFEVFSNLLLENGGCSFPCWWGIKPEQSALTELELLSTKIGKSPYIHEMDEYQIYDYLLSLDDLRILDMSISFYSKDGVIQYLTMVLEQPVRLKQYRQALLNLSVKKIFAQYGKPTNIYIVIHPPVEPNDNTRYSVYIQYSNYGFTIEYGGGTKNAQNINVCTGSMDDTNMQIITIYLGNQIQGLELNSFYTLEELKNIEDVTDTTIEQIFNDAEISSEPFCLMTSIDMWN